MAQKTQKMILKIINEWLRNVQLFPKVRILEILIKAFRISGFRIRFRFESSFWISLSGCKLTIFPNIQPANRIVIISTVQYCCCCEWISDKVFDSSSKGVSPFLASYRICFKTVLLGTESRKPLSISSSENLGDIWNDKHVEVDVQQTSPHYFGKYFNIELKSIVAQHENLAAKDIFGIRVPLRIFFSFRLNKNNPRDFFTDQ